MGELPPLHTPQGPDVPRALRPRFPRVDSSGTSRVPSSRSASFPFLPLPCVQFSPVLSTVRYSFLHGSLRPRSLVFLLRFLPVLPLPCVRFPSVSPLRSPRRLRVRLLPLPRVSLRDGSSASVVFSPSFPFLASSSFQFGYVFLSFPSASSCFLPLPSLSFRPVLSGSLHSRPLRSPAVFPPTRRSDSSPFSFRIPGSAAPLSGLGFCGPRVAPKRPHTTPQERQK